MPGRTPSEPHVRENPREPKQAPGPPSQGKNKAPGDKCEGKDPGQGQGQGQSKGEGKAAKPVQPKPAPPEDPKKQAGDK